MWHNWSLLLPATYFPALKRRTAEWWHPFWSRGSLRLDSADGTAQLIEVNYHYFNTGGDLRTEEPFVCSAAGSIPTASPDRFSYLSMNGDIIAPRFVSRVTSARAEVSGRLFVTKMSYGRFATLFVFLLASLSLQGQTNQGIIAGTVVDQTGAAVGGAKVVAKSSATGASLTATSGGDGSFRFPSLTIGTYDLTVSQSGFGTVTQSSVVVNISQTTALTISLKVGEATTSVTVQAEATSIETQTSEIGTNIGSKQVVELPLALGGVGAMRSPEAFMFLAPGTAGPGTANSNNGIFISKIGGGQNFRERSSARRHQHSANRKWFFVR